MTEDQVKWIDHAADRLERSTDGYDRVTARHLRAIKAASIADTAEAKAVNAASVVGEARRDAIARSKRILALVDEYANVQSKYNRDVLLETLFNEFAATPASSVADAAGAKDAERYRWIATLQDWSDIERMCWSSTAKSAEQFKADLDKYIDAAIAGMK